MNGCLAVIAVSIYFYLSINSQGDGILGLKQITYRVFGKLFTRMVGRQENGARKGEEERMRS